MRNPSYSFNTTPPVPIPNRSEAINQSSWLRLWTCEHVKIKHLGAHNHKYSPGWAGERGMNKNWCCPSTAFPLFIRCACTDEYSMKLARPSLYAIHVYFPLTLTIILLQFLQSEAPGQKQVSEKWGPLRSTVYHSLFTCTVNILNIKDSLWLFF